MNQSINTRGIYTSADLALVAAISLQLPIEGIDRTRDSHKAYFIFKKTPELDRLVDLYFRGEMRVNPSSYFQQLRLIKSRLYEER